VNPLVQIDNDRILFALANRRRIAATESASLLAGILSSFAATLKPITVSKGARIISNTASTTAALLAGNKAPST
jgi:hypothetical protein